MLRLLFPFLVVEQLSIEHCASPIVLKLNGNLDKVIVAVFAFRYGTSVLFVQPPSHRSRTNTLLRSSMQVGDKHSGQGVCLNRSTGIPSLLVIFITKCKQSDH